MRYTKTHDFDPLLAMAVQGGAEEGRIRTRAGLPARIVCTDLMGSFPVIALIKVCEGEEMITVYTRDGHYRLSGTESGYDLIIETVERKDAGSDGMKLCRKCGRLLPLAAFGRHNGRKDGLQDYCKDCMAERSKVRKKNESKR